MVSCETPSRRVNIFLDSTIILEFCLNRRFANLLNLKILVQTSDKIFTHPSIGIYNHQIYRRQFSEKYLKHCSAGSPCPAHCLSVSRLDGAQRPRATIWRTVLDDLKCLQQEIRLKLTPMVFITIRSYFYKYLEQVPLF